jgi:hypothetical protein
MLRYRQNIHPVRTQEPMPLAPAVTLSKPDSPIPRVPQDRAAECAAIREEISARNQRVRMLSAQDWTPRQIADELRMAVSTVRCVLYEGNQTDRGEGREISLQDAPVAAWRQASIPKNSCTPPHFSYVPTLCPLQEGELLQFTTSR